jgi:spore coat protein CotF
VAYLSGGHPSAKPVAAKKAIRAAAIVATLNTNPNLRISLTSRAALMDARLRKG